MDAYRAWPSRRSAVPARLWRDVRIPGGPSPILRPQEWAPAQEQSAAGRGLGVDGADSSAAGPIQQGGLRESVLRLSEILDGTTSGPRPIRSPRRTGAAHLEKLYPGDLPSAAWYFRRHTLRDAATRLWNGTREVVARFFLPERKLVWIAFAGPTISKAPDPGDPAGGYCPRRRNRAISSLRGSSSGRRNSFDRRCPPAAAPGLAQGGPDVVEARG